MLLGGHHYLTFAALAENREWLCGTVASGGMPATAAFILAYAALIALSVPGGALFTITSGFLFGPLLGTTYAVIGATLGAIVVFIAARAGLAGLSERVGPWGQRLEAGFRANALNYLLVLRLIPIFPFWLINLVAAAVGLRLSTFVIGTVVGMIPGTLVFASLGSGFGEIVAEGRAPDLTVLFHPSVILPLLGLACLVLAPVFYKLWRTRYGPETA